jgi:SAM-dependent methyltransferase
MPQFSDFDTRHYHTLDVRTGYAEWVATYEDTVLDAMDIALLEEVVTIPWQNIALAADLGCGTGRTGAWLRQQGVGLVDGVDFTPQMLAVAASRGTYRRLVEADVTATGLETGAYDVVSVCLVDEHLPALEPLYAETFRLARPEGFLVVVGFHPHFIMAFGVPTHFDSSAGEPIAIETHLHLLSEHATAALQTGWRLLEMREAVIDDGWIAAKPRWRRYYGHPISFLFVWQKPGPL